MKTVLYVDDKQTELDKISQKFSTNGYAKENFQLIPTLSPKRQEDFERLFSVNSDVILMDLDLSKPDVNHRKSPFSGLTLATEIRQRKPYIPIVLFTRKRVFSDKLYSNVESKIPSWVDATIYKNELFDGEEKLIFLTKLIEGFEKLNNCKTKNFKTLLGLLKSPDEDYESIKSSDPPLNKKDGYSWTITDAANWIQYSILQYPGNML